MDANTQKTVNTKLDELFKGIQRVKEHVFSNPDTRVHLDFASRLDAAHKELDQIRQWLKTDHADMEKELVAGVDELHKDLEDLTATVFPPKP